MTLLAPLVALTSALCWGIADFGGGLISRTVRTSTVVVWSQVAGLLSLLAVLLISGQSLTIGPWLGWAVLGSVTGLIGLMSFYTALAIGKMGVVSPIAALGAIVPIGLAIVGGERPNFLQCIGIVVAMTGAVFAAGPELSGAGKSARAVALATIAGVCFGLSLYGVGRGSEDSVLLTTVSMRAVSMCCFVLTALILFLRAQPVPFLQREGISLRWWVSIALVGIGDAAANALFGWSRTMGLLSVTTVLASLYPVVTVIAARFVLQERLTTIQRVGVTTAMVGVLVLAAG